MQTNVSFLYFSGKLVKPDGENQPRLNILVKFRETLISAATGHVTSSSQNHSKQIHRYLAKDGNKINELAPKLCS